MKTSTLQPKAINKMEDTWFLYNRNNVQVNLKGKEINICIRYSIARHIQSR